MSKNLSPPQPHDLQPTNPNQAPAPPANPSPEDSNTTPGSNPEQTE